MNLNKFKELKMSQKQIRQTHERRSARQSPNQRQANQLSALKASQVYSKNSSLQSKVVGSQKSQPTFEIKLLKAQIEKLKIRCFQINQEKEQKQVRIKELLQQVQFYKNQMLKVQQLIVVPLQSKDSEKIARGQMNIDRKINTLLIQKKLEKILKNQRQADEKNFERFARQQKDFNQGNVIIQIMPEKRRFEQIKANRQKINIQQINGVRQSKAIKQSNMLQGKSQPMVAQQTYSNIRRSAMVSEQKRPRQVVKIQDDIAIVQKKQASKFVDSYDKKLESLFAKKKQPLSLLLVQYEKDKMNLQKKMQQARKKDSWVRRSAEGAKYEGQILNGKKHGLGIEQYPEGSKYQGQWVEDAFHGFGKISLNDDGFFQGYFNQNKMDKFGFYKFPVSDSGKKKKKGNSYLGEFRVGAQQGYGIYVYEQEEMMYEGQWKNNRYSGFGSISYGGQTTYKGQFLFGKKHGKGFRIDQNGKAHQQIWKNGVRKSVNGKTKMIKKDPLKKNK